eukprot:403332166
MAKLLLMVIQVQARLESRTTPHMARNNGNNLNVQLESRLNQSKERVRKPLIMAEDVENNINIYVVKKKGGSKANTINKNQQSNLNIQKLAEEKSSIIQQQNKHNFNPDKSQSRNQAIIDDLQRSIQSKRDDSRNKYSAVKSKVKQNMRSKTPQGRGAVLTQQQFMDQQNKKQRREKEIHQLENEVKQIENDLLFKCNNKDLVFETYKPKNRKGTDPDCLNINIGSNCASDNSTDESQNKMNLFSKKQFSSYEYQLQNHNFSDKYFDKVYLELCGFSDLQTGQSHHLEKQKSNYEVKPKSSQVICNSQLPTTVLSPKASQTVQQKDIVGTVTFFERRCDQPPKPQITPKRHAMVNLDSAYQTREAAEEDTQEQDEFQDSPTQIRRVEDFSDKGNFMNMQSVDRLEFDMNFGDEDQRRKREEMRAENQRLVDDFDNILNELIDQRKTASHMAFYEAINEYNYDKKQLDNAVYKDPNGSFQLAQSPTKRLICMKNSSIEHFKHIKERNLVDKSGEKRTNMIYMASPERSYVVKADQQIDYNLAFKKNPQRFYEEALNAPITKHKIQHQRPSLSPKNGRYEKKSTLGSQSSHSMSQKNLKTFNGLSTAKKSKRDHESYTIVSKQTTRPHNRINQKIKSKIEQKLADKLGSELTSQVLKALEEANLQEAINDIISQNSNLIDESNDSEHNQRVNKAMSVKSQQIQKQQFDAIRDDQSQKSNKINLNQKQNTLFIPSHERMESHSHQQPATRELRTSSNVADGQYIIQESGQISHRSGTSSKFYHSENNAHDEEEVRVNKAY